MTTEQNLQERIAALEAQLEACKQHNQQLFDALKLAISQINQHASTSQEHSAFRRLTQKQHAVLQMLLYGASNKEIAERFGVSESTAKTYVRAIGKKFDKFFRAEIVIEARETFQNFDATEYRRLTGLPKDLYENWEKYPEVTKPLVMMSSIYE